MYTTSDDRGDLGGGGNGGRLGGGGHDFGAFDSRAIPVESQTWWMPSIPHVSPTSVGTRSVGHFEFSCAHRVASEPKSPLQIAYQPVRITLELSANLTCWYNFHV